MGSLYDINNMCTASYNYGLATELNKARADILNVLADQVLNRADVANLCLHANHNMCLASCTLEEGTGNLEIANSIAFFYLIGGAMYYQATSTGAVIANAGTALLITSAKYGCYLITVNATGDFYAYLGTGTATGTAAARAGLAAITPVASVAPIGIINVRASAGHGFSLGATTASYGDIGDDASTTTFLDLPFTTFAAFQAAVTQTDNAAYSQTFAAIT